MKVFPHSSHLLFEPDMVLEKKNEETETERGKRRMMAIKEIENGNVKMCEKPYKRLGRFSI